MTKYTLEQRIKILLPMAAVIGGTMGFSVIQGIIPGLYRITRPDLVKEIRSLEKTPTVRRYLNLTWATPGIRDDLLENSVVISEPLHAGYLTGAFLGTLLGGWYLLRSQKAYEELKKEEKS